MDDRERRAAARATWPVRTFRLGEEPPDDLLATTTPEERLRMVGRITADVWALTGRPMPTYTRDRIPVRVIRLHEDE